MRTLLICLLLLVGAQLRAEEVLRASGTGSGSILLEKLAHLYEQQKVARKDFRLTVLTPPLGSSGALRALAAGRIDLAIIGRPPKPDEGSFRSFELGRTPLVFAGRDKRSPATLSRRELVDIYGGKRRTWDDGTPIRLVLRAPFESDTMILNEMGPEMKAAVESALERKAGPVGENDLDTLELLSSLPGSFGPTTLSLLRLQKRELVIFALDGVTPGVDTLESGRYPLEKRFHIVTRSQPDVATQAFLTFLHSAPAGEFLRQNGHIPGAR